MSISGIAREIKMSRTVIQEVISGRRLSPVTEQRIADFLGKPVDYLFPRRCPAEIRAMREAEAAAKAALLPCEGNAA
jgi:transcriptional regulator with XRE-family HTH domain